MKAIELFTGAGGLAISLTNAQVSHRALIEWDHDCCNTIRRNINFINHDNNNIEIFEGDAKSFNYKSINETIDIVAGGPPCQPFSDLPCRTCGTSSGLLMQLAAPPLSAKF